MLCVANWSTRLYAKDAHVCCLEMMNREFESKQNLIFVWNANEPDSWDNEEAKTETKIWFEIKVELNEQIWNEHHLDVSLKDQSKAYYKNVILFKFLTSFFQIIFTSKYKLPVNLNGFWFMSMVTDIYLVSSLNCLPRYS